MQIKEATKDDAREIIAMIRELAAYEKMSECVKIEERTFCEHLFERSLAGALVAYEGGAAVGYAIYFYSFSTFLGRAGVYLEDIYVRPEFRGRGAGLAMVRHLAQICERECYGRLEWECLDWNEPSIKFYESLGAKRQSGWLKFRMTADEIKKIAKI